MATGDEQGLLQLFEELVPEEQWRELEGGAKPAQIYTLPVVVAMMLLQRLNERGTQQEVVNQMVMGRLDRLLTKGERVPRGKSLRQHRRLCSGLWPNRGGSGGGNSR